MDIFSIIKERRSCRAFLPEPIPEETIAVILEAAIWAPSPMNAQPWEFIVVTSQETKKTIFSESETLKQDLLQKSGWKWLGRYNVDFLLSAPVLVVVVADPEKTGADRFIEGGGLAYQHGCAAAVQNMLLAAHALGLGSLWFTLYDAEVMRNILGVQSGKVPLAVVCLGKPSGETLQVHRKDASEKTRFIR
ncbi:MAG: nitroreductase family protein [Syntrophobacteraceae bacterium]